MANFQTAYELTAQNEGGYRNVPWDSGGETYRGISRVNNPNWIGWGFVDGKKANYHQNKIPTGTIFPDIEGHVKTFYRTNYWNAVKGDGINNQQLANLIYDFKVQSGKAVQVIQDSINKVMGNGTVVVDNDFGAQTLAAVNAAPAAKLHNQILLDRKSYYQWLLSLGKISINDWQGILNRLARYPLITATAGVGVVILAAGLFFLLVRNKQ